MERLLRAACRHHVRRWHALERAEPALPATAKPHLHLRFRPALWLLALVALSVVAPPARRRQLRPHPAGPALSRCGWVLAVAISIFGTLGCGGQTTSAPNVSHMTDCRGATEAVANPRPPGPGVSYVSMTVDGELRDYMLYMPPTLDHSRPIPLVIMFHGSPVDAAGMEDLIHFDAEADKGRFLAAWPNGCDGLWSYADGGSKIADEDFVEKMIQQLESRYSIDQARVFLAGLSAGTWVEYRLACDLAGMITAVASISGTMRLSDDCRPSRPVSILEMHGTVDDVH